MIKSRHPPGNRSRYLLAAPSSGLSRSSEAALINHNLGSMKVMTKPALAAIDTVGVLFEDYGSGHWGRSLVGEWTDF
jgi:hypothetical protein